MNSVVIVAAGSSRRMGFNKLLAEIDGQAVLARSIQAFEDSELVGEIIVVSGGDTLEEVRNWQDSGRFPKLAKAVEGGAERHFSVKNGLDLLNSDSKHIAVHDGARPLISQQAIRDCFESAVEYKAAACAHPITDTVKRSDADGFVAEGVNREGLWGMETPQAFEVPLLKKAYDHVLATDTLVTDEVSAVEAIGHPVKLVSNATPNPKITFEADLAMAERLLGVGAESRKA